MAALGSAADNVAAAISTLEQYSACDVSDVLLKLGVPGAGFLPDLVLLSASSSARNQQQQQQHHHTRPTVAAASTVLFVPKHPVEEERQEQPKEQYPPGNIANDMHWADLTVPGTIVVIKQPEGQKNAVCGGIMALRLAMLGAKGIVVLGRARDVAELRDTGLPVRLSSLITVVFQRDQLSQKRCGPCIACPLPAIKRSVKRRRVAPFFHRGSASLLVRRGCVPCPSKLPVAHATCFHIAPEPSQFRYTLPSPGQPAPSFSLC